MKLLFQSDDYGITEGVTLGILKGIEKGLVRNTGLFVNTESSKFAASKIKDYLEVDFGLDINLVAGKPISNPEDVKSLVDENGDFIKSTDRYKNNKIKSKSKTGVIVEFEEDPYKYEEVLLEMENQLKKYIELVGKKPAYIHPHSLVTPTTLKAFREIAKKNNLKFSMDLLKKNEFYSVSSDWNIKPIFKTEDQKNTNVEKNILDEVDEILKHEKSVLICHCGYVDAKLLELSSYNLIRVRDLEMATSKTLIKILEDNDVELIRYRDL